MIKSFRKEMRCYKGKSGIGGGGGGGSRISSEDAAIRTATGGVILSNKRTEIEVDVRKRNKSASNEYSKEVLSATVDSNGNVKVNYASGDFSGNYGDEYQTVKYNLNAGFVDGQPFNMDLSKANSISGKTYPVKEAAKAAGMTWNSSAGMYIGKNHILNTKTNYSASELSSLNRATLEKTYTAIKVKKLMAQGESEAFARRGLAERVSKRTNEWLIEYIKRNG